MAIVLTKPKLAPLPTAEPQLTELQKLIDDAGRLQAGAEAITKKIAVENEKLKPYHAALAALNTAIQAMEVDEDATAIEVGAEYKAEIGKKGSSRSISDLQLAKTMMGPELFMKVAKVTLKDIDSYLTLPQRDQVLETTRTTRSYKLIRRV